MPKASSRPGTAKNVRSGTIRPGATSAALAVTALATNDGVCLQVSNKKDERAKKVWCRAWPLIILWDQPCLDAYMDAYAYLPT